MTAVLLGGVGFLDEIGRSLREGFFMFWETLWPLILGFSLSGAVQAFVSREALQAKLGDHGPGAVARASGYGMASSSCSYAASAMAKSLFTKGADFVAAAVRVGRNGRSLRRKALPDSERQLIVQPRLFVGSDESFHVIVARILNCLHGTVTPVV